jgi:hypothetical protein
VRVRLHRDLWAKPRRLKLVMRVVRSPLKLPDDHIGLLEGVTTCQLGGSWSGTVSLSAFLHLPDPSPALSPDLGLSVSEWPPLPARAPSMP